METGNWIALGAVGVALISNATTLYLGRRRLDFDRESVERRFAHERQMEDRRIAGEILDEAVLELRRIDDVLKQAKLLLRNRPQRFFSFPKGNDLYKTLSSSGTELDQRADRLRFRFEGHHLVDAFEDAMDATASIYEDLGQIAGEDYDGTDDAVVKKEIREFCEGKRELIHDCYEAFTAGFDEFRKAAFAVVGISEQDV